MKKVLILGIDGYIGYALACHLGRQGYIITGVDNGSRRRRVNSAGSDSLTPILGFAGRSKYLFERYNCRVIDLSLGHDSPGDIGVVLSEYQPDTIVHLAEQPSAPWSMRDVDCAAATHTDNVLGTLHLLWAMKTYAPKAHLVKLGTMGEYGTPDCRIPEGKIPGTCLTGHVDAGNDPVECHMAGLLFPRTPGSFYHATKVHDTVNIEFACRTWDLCCTDIMQGIVYGLNDCLDSNAEITRFDYDEYFGTVINRFCVQALLNYPLTVYGKGGQTRGFLPLRESLECLNLIIDNPASRGEYRTANQFGAIYSVSSIASIVSEGAKSLGLNGEIGDITNPRIENEHHWYDASRNLLFSLGYKPSGDTPELIRELLDRLLYHHTRIQPGVILPTTKWK